MNSRAGQTTATRPKTESSSFSLLMNLLKSISVSAYVAGGSTSHAPALQGVLYVGSTLAGWTTRGTSDLSLALTSI